MSFTEKMLQICAAYFEENEKRSFQPEEKKDKKDEGPIIYAEVVDEKK